jgi:hypothetical protein
VQIYGKPQVEYYLEDCVLRAGVGKRLLMDIPLVSESARRRKGEKGEKRKGRTLVIELDNALIRGKPSSEEEARRTLFQAWNTQKEGITKNRESGRWTVGPMAEVAAAKRTR